MSYQPANFWAIVSVNLVNRAVDENEFNEWYDRLHVPEFVACDGFSYGWRIGHTENDAQRGEDTQEFSAIYAIDQIDHFTEALDASPTAGHSWMEWDGRISDWTRLYYMLLFKLDLRPGDLGKTWVLVQSTLKDNASAEEDEFVNWYLHEHMPEICDRAKAHRAWLLRAHRHDSQLGDHPTDFLAVYEVESPDMFVNAREGQVPWGGTWEPRLAEWRRSFHDVLLNCPKG